MLMIIVVRIRYGITVGDWWMTSTMRGRLVRYAVIETTGVGVTKIMTVRADCQVNGFTHQDTS